MSDQIAISNLIYEYARLIDSGDFAELESYLNEAKLSSKIVNKLLKSQEVKRLKNYMKRQHDCTTMEHPELITQRLISL